MAWARRAAPAPAARRPACSGRAAAAPGRPTPRRVRPAPRRTEGWPLMESAEIVRRFLTYFEQQDHAIVPSASLVADDPTLMFVVAGMQPFKPYLLGQQTPPWKRVADVQKCLRTLDIEEVGKTTRHATFFQMLGNWSFGDYFKDKMIPWAWELLTKSEADGGFGFPESKLWATVLHGDDEAYAIWRNEIGLS